MHTKASHADWHNLMIMVWILSHVGRLSTAHAAPFPCFQYVPLLYQNHTQCTQKHRMQTGAISTRSFNLQTNDHGTCIQSAPHFWFCNVKRWSSNRSCPSPCIGPQSLRYDPH